MRTAGLLDSQYIRYKLWLMNHMRRNTLSALPYAGRKRTISRVFPPVHHRTDLEILSNIVINYNKNGHTSWII